MSMSKHADILFVKGKTERQRDRGGVLNSHGFCQAVILIKKYYVFPLGYNDKIAC